MSAIFVTATGTDVGKTFVTAGLVRTLRRRGQTVDALKPVVSGFDPRAAGDSDPALLLRALGEPVEPEEIARIAPWRFRAPLSPDQAARREGRTLDVEALIAYSRKAAAETPGTLFIEGVGGIMVPLDDRRTVLDWMTALGLPALLVTGSYLGTISHTLCALDVLSRRGLAVAAIVVSESAGEAPALDETAAAIARFAAPAPVIALPRLGSPDSRDPAFDVLADMLAGG